MIGATLMALRRYAEADQWLDRALALEPANYKALLRKTNLALLTGNIELLKKLMVKIPPDVVPRLVPDLKFEAAYISRKPKQALAVLKKAPAWITSINTLPSLPASLLKADACALRGDKVRAREYYLRARDEARDWLRLRPGNPGMTSALGMAEAGLGNKQQAIRDGRYAVNYVPVSHDVLLGSFYLVSLAQIYGRLHEAGPAVKVLDQLLSIPAGRAVSVKLLKIDPLWDGIRDTPAFQALLKKYAAPVVVTSHARAAP
ncbi:MAG TPA: hypothetical protein VFL97_11175 [Nitrococcus sp.]|nr:hypothetical protein [Nitrococcus sp.]